VLPGRAASRGRQRQRHPALDREGPPHARLPAGMVVARRIGGGQMTSGLKVGVLPFPQYTDWASLMEVAHRIDELGYDSLWTWDHLYPIVGDWKGPIFEGYMTLAGWAADTKKVT